MKMMRDWNARERSARIVSVFEASVWIGEVEGFGVLSNPNIRGGRLHCCAPRRASCR